MKLLKDTPRPRRKRLGRGRKGEGSLKLRGSVWWYVIPGPKDSPRIERSCETSDYQTALAVKARALLESRQPVPPPPPGSILVDSILDDYAIYCESERLRSWRSLKTGIKHLREAFGTIRACDLTTAHTDAFRRTRVAAGISNSSVNRELGYFRAALKRELECTPPRIAAIPCMRTTSEKDCVREGFIGRTDGYVRILAELPASLRAIFVCAFHTGARLGELRAIRWPQVNFEQEIVELQPKTTKNRDGRWIPIWGDMRHYLLEQKRVRDACFPECEHVFFWHDAHHHRAVPGRPIKDFRFCWHRACEAAGFPDLLFHDLRRSAIRYADQEAKMSSILVRGMSGHKTESVYARYNIVGGKDIQRLGRELDAHLAASNAKVVPIKRQA